MTLEGALVGARLLGRGLPSGVQIASPATLSTGLRELSEKLSRAEADQISQHARRSSDSRAIEAAASTDAEWRRGE